MLDRTPQPGSPLDILAQQIVAACVAETWDEDELFRALPPRLAVPRSRARGLRRDGRRARRAVAGRCSTATASDSTIRATRRARLTAITSGGAIPDNADYQVILEPEGTLVGTLNEDFAIESNGGDIFQLGTASWRILRVERRRRARRRRQGRAADHPVLARRSAGPHAPSSRTSSCGVREDARDAALSRRSAGHRRGERASDRRLRRRGRARARRAFRRRQRVILERFFDESGGMQLVVHAPFGGRINRAWGLALRKRFCRGFGFELQAAANEEAIVLSLGPQHSFPLEEVFDYLQPDDRARRCSCRRCSTRRCSRPAGAGTCRARSCSNACAAASARRRRSCACAPTICWRRAFPRSSPAAKRCRRATSRSRWSTPSCGKRSTIACTRRWTSTASSRCCAGCATAASSGRASTRPSPRRSRTGFSRRSRTPSSTTRRSRSAARRPCSRAARST